MRFLIIGLWAAAAVAYGAENPTSRILACAKVSGDAERLSCYDELARGLSNPPAGSSASDSAAMGSAAAAPPTATSDPAPRTPGSAASRASQMREFGLPLIKPSSEQPIKAVKATVTATYHRPGGALVIDLDNGQRWQQLGSADMELEVGDSVTISRAMLGSFWLAPPSGRGSKVSRLR
jgi:hypothetical protein